MLQKRRECPLDSLVSLKGSRRLLCVLASFSILLQANPSLGKFPRDNRQLTSCSAFTSLEEIEALFTSYERDHIGLAQTFVVGTSVQNRDIFGLRLSAAPDTETPEPEIRILGGIHGDECMSVELVLEIADYLIQSYGEEQFATELLDGTELLLIPSLNPDGYAALKAYRFNANGVDLNRNFHFAWVDGGPKPFSEPESRAFRDLSQDNNFVMSLSYHTVATYVNATWNYTPHHPPDEALFAAMGTAYAGVSGYDVTFGWDWYGIYGDVDDWSLGTSGTFGWTIELRDDEEMEFSVHLAGLQDFLAYAFVGVRGKVTDSVTGEPLLARMEIEPAGAPVYTDADVGDYHRILLPGHYSITAHSPGYLSQTMEDVMVGNEGHLELNFSLTPKPSESVDFAFTFNGMTLPQEIDDSFSRANYLNETVVWNALGEPDGVVYSLSPGGTVTLDMGLDGSVQDSVGTDLVIVSGSISDDPVSVQVAAEQDGPFVTVGQGDGHIEVDISESGLQSIRFVRIVDDGGGSFADRYAGYDLDGIVDVTRGSYTPPIDPEPDEGDDGDCGCHVLSHRDESDLIRILRSLFSAP